MNSSGTIPRSALGRGTLPMLGLAALISVLPVWVRAQEPAEERKVIKLRVGGQGPGGAGAGISEVDARQLEAELQKKLAEVHELEARLKQAHERAKKLAAEKANPGVRVWDPSTNEKRIVIALPGMVGVPGQKQLFELVPGEKGILILRPVTAMEPKMPPAAPSAAPKPPAAPTAPLGQPGKLSGPGAPAADGRTKDLEKRLDAIMTELEQLRRELKRNPQPMGYTAPKPDLPGRPEKEEASNSQREAALQAALQALKAAEAAQRAAEERQRR